MKATSTFDGDSIVAAVSAAFEQLRAALTGPEAAWQAAIVLGALLVAVAAAVPLRRLIAAVFPAGEDETANTRRWRDEARRLALPLVWLMAQLALSGVAERAGISHELVRVTSTLLAAWIVIHVASALLADEVWARSVAIFAWLLAALRITHLLEPTVAFLDGLAMTFGSVRVSAYLLLKGVIVAALLLKLALSTSTMLQRRIDRFPNLTPSVRVLISQLLRISLITMAVVVALGSVGIDLTAFAVFSGALGVGIGFGLQKVVSNIVSGIILLVDRSVKPGDVIEIGDTYGWVNSLGARYAGVVTRDGTEHLIPNEDLITQPVINWSYSDTFVRRKIRVGVHYASDIDKATEVMMDAVQSTERVLSDPHPSCFLVGFGDSSVDFEIRFWIADPQNGTANVTDKVLRKVWHGFREAGIEIPYPQRDLHLRSSEVVRVQTVSDQDRRG